MRPRVAFWICFGFVLLFAILCWTSVTSKSATMDEPLHAVAGYTHFFLGDFRVNPEDPPLWKYWMMLPQRAGEIRVDLDRKDLSNPTADFVLGSTTLYQTPVVDGAAFVNRSRAMMLMLGILLAVVVTRAAWVIAGPKAAVVAAGFFCLDPNFLAHAALVKNDVALSLVMFGAVYATYSVGRRINASNLVAMLLLCAIAPVVKFSGILIPPLVAGLLILRAVLPGPWLAFRRELVTRAQRLIASGPIIVVASMVTFTAIWAVYGFRYLPTPDPKLTFDFAPQAQTAAANAYFATNHSTTENPPAPHFARAILWTNDRRLLPQPWLFGLLYTYQTTLLRPAFLLDRISEIGWWYYFPLAFLFKTPIATVIALASAIVILIRRRIESRWLILCITIPIAIYLYNAMTTSLNLGIRHLLPVYPFLFLLIAIGLARLLRMWPAVLMIVALGAETLIAYPNYIPFFNAVSSPYRLSLLSDSNLDWGQDLPALANWQQRHPTQRLYLCYFGSADPAFYNITYTNLPSGYFLNPIATVPDAPGVIAVSATKLQGLYIYPAVKPFYDKLRAQKPREILNDSIYLFDVHP